MISTETCLHDKWFFVSQGPYLNAAMLKLKIQCMNCGKFGNVTFAWKASIIDWEDKK